MAGHSVPREGRGLGDTIVGFRGPGPAAGQAWGRERCLGPPCGRRAHTHADVALGEGNRQGGLWFTAGLRPEFPPWLGLPSHPPTRPACFSE